MNAEAIHTITLSMPKSEKAKLIDLLSRDLDKKSPKEISPKESRVMEQRKRLLRLFPYKTK